MDTWNRLTAVREEGGLDKKKVKGSANEVYAQPIDTDNSVMMARERRGGALVEVGKGGWMETCVIVFNNKNKVKYQLKNNNYTPNYCL